MKRVSWPIGGLLFVFVMATAVAAIYGSGVRFGYVFDDLRLSDGSLVLTNPYSLSIGFRSLTTASFQWVHQVIGPENYWQRGFNILVHILNALMLWKFTERLLERAWDEQQRLSGAEPAVYEKDTAVRAAGLRMGIVLWALNPVAVYAVAYLIQRSTLMATGFMILAMLSFVEGLRTKNWIWYGLMILCYALVLMSKEHGAPMIALLLPLYAWWQRPSRATLLRVGSVLAGGAIAVGVFVYIRKGWVLGGTTEDLVQPFIEQLRAINPDAVDRVFELSVLNQMWLFFRYGVYWFLPWTGWLSIDIRTPFPTEWLGLHLLGAVAYLLAIGFAVWLTLARRGWMSLLGLLFLMPAMLYVPEFAYVRLQEPFVLYRSYLWSIAFPALLSTLFILLLADERKIYLLGAGLAIVFGVMTYERIQTFRDNISAWRDALEKVDREAPQNVLGRWRPPLNVSAELINRGNSEEAWRLAVVADQLGAPLGMGKFNQASALNIMGRYDQTLDLYAQAEREGFPNRAILYKERGQTLLKLGKADAALNDFDRALSVAENDVVRATVLLAAGRAANSAGQYDRAIEYYTKLGALQPELTAVPIGIAYSWYKKGDVTEAFRSLNQSLSKKPTADVLHARSFLFYQLGNLQRALGDVEVALTLDPQNSVYLGLRQNILASLPEAQKAATP